MAKHAASRTPKPLKYKDARKLDSIETLFNRGKLDEAEQALTAFTRANPNVVEGWALLYELATLVQDKMLAWKSARQLVILEPGEELHRYNMAVSYAALASPFSTLKHARYYLEHFPRGAYRKQVGEIEKMSASVCEELLRGDEMAQQASNPDDLTLFEEAQILVSSGEVVEGRKLSQEAAKRLPGAPAPLNNISLAYAIEGNFAEALKITQQVLELHPENFPARCNLAQLYIRLGRDAEAQPNLDKLCQETPKNSDHWAKLIETLAIAGDDHAVVALYKRAQKHLGSDTDTLLPPLIRHFVATAHARLGNEREAKSLWQKALTQARHLRIAEDNLDDIQLPVGERNGTWYFPFHQWVMEKWVRQLEQAVKQSLNRRQDRLQKEIERVFQNNPALKPALSILMKQGDPVGVELMLHLASQYPLPGLRDFALGRHGSDQDRIEAAQYAAQHGLLDASQPVTLYIKGNPTELLLLNYEIYNEPVESDLPQQAQESLEAAHRALQDNQPEEALEWIAMGLEIVPEERTFLHYKAVAFSLLKRPAEAKEVIEHMAALYPDYLFARCAMAQLCVQENRLDEAEAWLKPLILLSRLHYSEFKALVLAQVALLKARGQQEGANAWLQMLQQFEFEQAMDFDDDDEGI